MRTPHAPIALPEPVWSASAEDQSFRSQFVQWLLHCAPAEQTPAFRAPPIPTGLIPRVPIAKVSIPKVLVQYWHDLAVLPADVAQCLKSWHRLKEDGFAIQLFDDACARKFIAQFYEPRHVMAFDRCYHPAMRCDYFRLCYVLHCGGFYVDADELYLGTGWEALYRDNQLKVQPLCYDNSTRQMVPLEEFLGDASFPSSRIFYVNNNPIIAPPGHPLIYQALRRATELLLQATERPEIQSTTGPGNFTSCLVRHAMQLHKSGSAWDFTILRNWTSLSFCRWPLSYRNDRRNWRLANASGGR